MPRLSAAMTGLGVLKNLLLNVSDQVGAKPHDQVLKSFIEFLKKSSPQLKLAILLITPWAMLISAASKYKWICNLSRSAKDYILGKIYSSVTIPSSHPLQKQVMEYMSEKGLGENARSLALDAPSGAAKRPSHYIDMYGRQKRAAEKHGDKTENQQLSYVPEINRNYTFWFRGHRMTFEKKETTQRYTDDKNRIVLGPGMAGSENIIISCPTLFAGAKPIKDFLEYVKTTSFKEHTTTIYRADASSNAWDQGIVRPSRNLKAVTLDAGIKDNLVSDIEKFLAPATRKWYLNRGIPYRRGFLFYGPPGTGKTSFATALAGHFKLNVYMLSLSNKALNDNILESIFELLPSRCIVLLEDIDSSGIRREDMRTEEMRAEADKDQKADKAKKTRSSRPVAIDEYGQPVIHDRGGITLSGLLNVLDGIQAKEGQITIMTSNTPDSLDPALVRPGRIDRKILFGYSSKEVICKLFRHIFEKSPEEMIAGEQVDSEINIPSLAEAFAAKIPAERLTPAEIQGYLLVQRTDAVKAVAEADEWVRSTLATKAQGANVAKFTTDTDVKESLSPKASDDQKQDVVTERAAVAQSQEQPPKSQIPSETAVAGATSKESSKRERRAVEKETVTKAPEEIPIPEDDEDEKLFSDDEDPSTTSSTDDEGGEESENTNIEVHVDAEVSRIWEEIKQLDPPQADIESKGTSTTSGASHLPPTPPPSPPPSKSAATSEDSKGGKKAIVKH